MKNHLHCFICRGAISLLLCLSFFTNAFSQHLILGNEDFKVEAGLNFGPTTFLGDLGGNAGYGTKGLKDVNSYQKGDQLIYVNIWTPQSLTKEEKELLSKLKDSESFKPNPGKNDKTFFERMKEFF